MSVCPKCGADLAGEGIGFTDYSCGTSAWDDVGVRESFDCLRRQLQQEREKVKVAEQNLGNLLAVIFRDGGQYRAELDDDALAVEKAHQIWATMQAEAAKP